MNKFEFVASKTAFFSQLFTHNHPHFVGLASLYTAGWCICIISQKRKGSQQHWLIRQYVANRSKFDPVSQMLPNQPQCRQCSLQHILRKWGIDHLPNWATERTVLKLLYKLMTRFYDNLSPWLEEQICGKVELPGRRGGDSPGVGQAQYSVLTYGRKRQRSIYIKNMLRIVSGTFECITRRSSWSFSEANIIGGLKCFFFHCWDLWSGVYVFLIFNMPILGVDNIPTMQFPLDFPEILSQNLLCYHWLSVWEFRNNALWDTLQHASQKIN